MKNLGNISLFPIAMLSRKPWVKQKLRQIFAYRMMVNIYMEEECNRHKYHWNILYARRLCPRDCFQYRPNTSLYTHMRLVSDTYREKWGKYINQMVPPRMSTEEYSLYTDDSIKVVVGAIGPIYVGSWGRKYKRLMTEISIFTWHILGRWMPVSRLTMYRNVFPHRHCAPTSRRVYKCSWNAVAQNLHTMFNRRMFSFNTGSQ